MRFDPRRSVARLLSALPFSLVLMGGVGCGPSPEANAVLTAEASDLKPLSILYGQYLASNENRPPASEIEFKKFIKDRGQPTLEEFSTDIDQMFVSPRDGKPYIVVYRERDPLPSGVIAYEREGVDGKRIVAHPYGSVALVDEIRFRELVPNAP